MKPLAPDHFGHDPETPSPEFQEWCFKSTAPTPNPVEGMADDMPVLTFALYSLCDNDEDKFQLALQIVQRAFEDGRKA